jgi:hypothetical protein
MLSANTDSALKPIVDLLTKTKAEMGSLQLTGGISPYAFPQIATIKRGPGDFIVVTPS